MNLYKIKIWILSSTVVFGFLFFSGLFLKNVYTLQFSNSEYFQNQALSYRVETEVLKSKRGSIYDRNLNLVSSSSRSFNVALRPKDIKDPYEVSNILSSFLGLSREYIYEKIESNNNYFYLLRNIDYEKGIEIDSWSIDGVILEESNKRILHNESLKNIVGKVDADGYGIEGLELYFDYQLQGTDGEITYEVSPNGKIIPQGEIRTVQPVHGEDLLLTLDSELQYLTEQLCFKALLETSAYNCSVVFANANTGEIIISAEQKSQNENFNINLISTRAQYEPGSSFKIFSIGHALDENIVSLNDVFLVEDTIEIISGSCNNDYKGYKGCYKDFLNHEPYNLTIKEILERSSNVGTILATQELEVEKLENFLKIFGFTSKTGVELTGEAKGSFDKNKTCATCLSSLSIGYSANVTQMQMVKAYSIIVNGGKDISLSMVKKPYLHKNRTQVIDEELSETLKGFLINVVEGENGTAKSLKMEDYTIGGKTGTSRTHIEGVGYSSVRFNTSFTGFVETSEGPIVGSVILWGASTTSPQFEYVTGGSTAAPIFKTIVSYFSPNERK
jgi:cell division protein FtsI (penicillin-binding protein 3)